MNRRRLLQSIAAVFIPSVKARPKVVAPIAPSSEAVRVLLEMDGRALAEFIVPHIPGIVRRYRLQ